MKLFFWFILFAIFFTGCTMAQPAKIKETPTEMNLQTQTPLPISEIEALARIKIPESATGVQAYAEYERNSAVYIKFQLPAGELSQFLISAGFNNIEKDFWPFYDLPITWWPKRNEFSGNPNKVFSGEEVSLASQRFAKTIGIDMTDKNIYTIYLLCFDV